MANELSAAVATHRGGSPTGHQFLKIATAVSILSQLFRRRTVGLGKQWRNSLHFSLVLETVHKILLREVIGRLGPIPEEISDGIIVLAMRKPPHENRWRNLSSHLGLRRYLCRAGGKSRQKIYPSNEDPFLVTPWHNQLSSSVLDAL